MNRLIRVHNMPVVHFRLRCMQHKMFSDKPGDRPSQHTEPTGNFSNVNKFVPNLKDFDSSWYTDRLSKLAGDSKKKASEFDFDSQWYSDQLHKILQNRQLSQRIVIATIVATVSGGALIMYNWKTVKSEVAKESADVSKELLDTLMTDEILKQRLSLWIIDLLTDMQDKIGALVVKILQQEQVIAQVRKLLDNLVQYLAANETIQKQVSDLLLKAIWLPSAQESVGKWVKSPTIVQGAQYLIQDVLASDSIQAQLSETIRTALADASVLEAARDAAWALVNPFWSRDKSLKKLAPEDIVQMLKKMRLSEEDKHAVAALALSMAFPATLDALSSRTLTDEEVRQLRDILESARTSSPDGSALTTPTGSAAPTDGSAAPTDGSAAPTDGSAAPTDGSAAPTDGSAAPAPNTSTSEDCASNCTREDQEEMEKVLLRLESSLRLLSTTLK